jgi:hypothetical protein
MPTPPESTRISLGQRLRERARQRWPALATVNVRHRGGFAYVTGELADGTALPLCRLRYGGYANRWGFAIYLASKDGYQDSILPSGYPVGTAEEALDCACGLYLNDPRPGTLSNPRRTSAQDHQDAARPEPTPATAATTTTATTANNRGMNDL